MRVLSVLGAAFAALVLACALNAGGNKVQPERRTADTQTTPAKPTLPKGTPAEQVATLIKQHEQAMTAFRKLFEAAQTEEEQEKLDPLYPEPNGYAKLLVQIAEQNPKDPAAVDALLWVVRNDSPQPAGAETPFARAKGILIRDHLKNPTIGPLCLVLRWDFKDPEAVAIIRRVLEGNANKNAQAQAAFALAKLLRERAGWARTLHKAEPKVLARLAKNFGNDNLDALKRGDAAALEKEAENLLERITKDKDFADTAIHYGDSQVKLGALADRELFQIRHLQPGKPAPEIVGEDIDGKPMKLSDFRGRVVLLDFWGHW